LRAFDLHGQRRRRAAFDPGRIGKEDEGIKKDFSQFERWRELAFPATVLLRLQPQLKTENLNNFIFNIVIFYPTNFLN